MQTRGKAMQKHLTKMHCATKNKCSIQQYISNAICMIEKNPKLMRNRSNTNSRRYILNAESHIS